MAPGTSTAVTEGGVQPLGTDLSAEHMVTLYFSGDPSVANLPNPNRACEANKQKYIEALDAAIAAFGGGPNSIVFALPSGCITLGDLLAVRHALQSKDVASGQTTLASGLKKRGYTRALDIHYVGILCAGLARQGPKAHLTQMFLKGPILADMLRGTLGKKAYAVTAYPTMAAKAPPKYTPSPRVAKNHSDSPKVFSAELHTDSYVGPKPASATGKTAPMSIDNQPNMSVAFQPPTPLNATAYVNKWGNRHNEGVEGAPGFDGSEKKTGSSWSPITPLADAAGEVAVASVQTSGLGIVSGCTFQHNGTAVDSAGETSTAGKPATRTTGGTGPTTTNPNRGGGGGSSGASTVKPQGSTAGTSTTTPNAGASGKTPVTTAGNGSVAGSSTVVATGGQNPGAGGTNSGGTPVVTGGATGSGGAKTGGATGAGGTQTGGATVVATGGARTGGATGSGGIVTGGMTSTGGMAGVAGAPSFIFSGGSAVMYGQITKQYSESAAVDPLKTTMMPIVEAVASGWFIQTDGTYALTVESRANIQAAVGYVFSIGPVRPEIGSYFKTNLGNMTTDAFVSGLNALIAGLTPVLTEAEVNAINERLAYCVYIGATVSATQVSNASFNFLTRLRDLAKLKCAFNVSPACAIPAT